VPDRVFACARRVSSYELVLSFLPNEPKLALIQPCAFLARPGHRGRLTSLPVNPLESRLSCVSTCSHLRRNPTFTLSQQMNAERNYLRNMLRGASPAHSEPGRRHRTILRAAISSEQWKPTVFSCGGRTPRNKPPSDSRKPRFLALFQASTSLERQPAQGAGRFQDGLTKAFSGEADPVHRRKCAENKAEC
jgi:hypothetical protein